MKKMLSVLAAGLLASVAVFAEAPKPAPAPAPVAPAPAAAQPAPAPVAYDKAAVQAIMKKNLALFGATKKAVEGNDFAAAGTGFADLSKNNAQLLKFNPPKGAAADWQKVVKDLLAAAKKGEDAAKAKDAEKLKAALADFMAAMKAGHGSFR